MTASSRALAFAVGVHLLRFGVIVGGLELAPLIGITGWYAGLFVNALCVLLAAGLVTCLGLWHRIGIAVAWRGWAALLPAARAARRGAVVGGA